MVSDELGYENAAPEAFINYLGYDALAKNHLKRAAALFQLNLQKYPNSNNAYGAYADYLISMHDSVNAVLYYKRALEIKNDVATQHKLEAITNSGKFTLSKDDLQKYAGVYILKNFNVEVELGIRGDGLWAVVKGQADDELTPLAKDVFTVRNKQGYTITFQMSGDRAIAFTSEQPNGTFDATLKR